MNLQNDARFSKFSNPTSGQIKEKFNLGLSYLRAAKFLFEQRNALKDKNANKLIYDHIYDGAKSIGETILLSVGLRAVKGEGYHVRVFEGSKLILNDPALDSLFLRLDKMRKIRGRIDYEPSAPDISDAGITAAIDDVQKFADEAKKCIEKGSKGGDKLL